MSYCNDFFARAARSCADPRGLSATILHIFYTYICGKIYTDLNIYHLEVSLTTISLKHQFNIHMHYPRVASDPRVGFSFNLSIDTFTLIYIPSATTISFLFIFNI